MRQGKCYYEVRCTDDGLSRVGWSLGSASFNLGMDARGFGFGGTGKKSNSRQFDTYGKPFGNGDVVGCFLDCDEGKIHFAVNGTR